MFLKLLITAMLFAAALMANLDYLLASVILVINIIKLVDRTRRTSHDKTIVITTVVLGSLLVFLAEYRWEHSLSLAVFFYIIATILLFIPTIRDPST